MFDTGAFSRMARVSKRTLRYYDSIDLLKPVETDPHTGTRFYSAEQFIDVNRIIALKELGMSLSQIRQIVEDDVSQEEILGMLLLRRAEAENALEQETRRLRSIEARLKHPDEFLAATGVVTKPVPAERFISVRSVLTTATMIETAISIMFGVPEILGRENLSHFASVMHWDSFDETEIDAEIGYLMADVGTADVGPAEVEIGDVVLVERELDPVADMATVVVTGGPSRYPAGFNEVGRWAEIHDVTLGAPQREVFLEIPDGDLDAAVIELQFPIVD